MTCNNKYILKAGSFLQLSKEPQRMWSCYRFAHKASENGVCVVIGKT